MARLVIEFDLDRPDTHDGYGGPYVSNVVVLAETQED